MWLIRLVIATSFLIGYLVGLLLKPKYCIALISACLLGIFVYLYFFAGTDASPTFATAVGWYSALFAPFFVVAYGGGAAVGAVIRWLAKKRKIYAVIVTVAVLICSFFYIDYYYTRQRQLEANKKQEKELILNFVKNHEEVKIRSHGVTGAMGSGLTFDVTPSSVWRF